VRFLGKDTAIEEGTFTVKAEGTPPQTSSYSTLHVRENGKWLFALVKEWEQENTQPTLEDLAWLIGEWQSEGEDAVAKTSYEWIEGKKFIRARYSIAAKKEGEEASGTQIIGADPLSGAIRVWTFASDGGIGHAFWRWDGEHWEIDSFGATGAGLDTSALNYLTRDGNDKFTWRAVKRSVGGEELTDLPAVTVKRMR
jgi:hypothetical protein